MLQTSLLNGLLYSTLLSIFVMGSLYYNPRLWLHDYPKAIQAKVPPPTREEKRLQRIVFAPMMLLLLGFPLYSVYSLKLAAGGTLSFGEAFANALVITHTFNIVDAVVLDLLILALMQPKFATIPGAEGMEYLYRDWGMHLRNFLKGVVICTVFAGIIALVVMVL